MPIMMLPVSEPESVSEPVSMVAMSIGFKKTPPGRRRQACLVLRLLLEALGLVGDAVLGRAQVGDRLRDGGEPLVHVHAVDRGQLELVSVGICLLYTSPSPRDA